MSYEKPTEKNIALISIVNLLFTRDIIAHSANAEGKVVFQTVSNHNFVANDHVKLFDAIDDNNYVTTFNGYSPSTARAFEVLSVTDDTITVDLDYDSSIDISSLQVRSVYVFNNDMIENFAVAEYPVCVLSTGDSMNKSNNACSYVPYITEFHLTILDALTNHGSDTERNTRVNSGGVYVQEKISRIMTALKKPISNDKIPFGLSVWGDQKVFFSGLSFKY